MLETQYPLVLSVYGYGVSEDQKTLYIVMELMDEDLLGYLDRKKLTLVEKVALMIRMVQCLHFLHSCQPRIIHRDVKSVNFLLSNEGKLLKICDFGIAKSKLSTVATASEGGKGTILWMAPELFKSGDYTKKSDVYALAMTFFEVLNEELPLFQEIGAGKVRCNAVSVHDFIKDGGRPKFKEDVPQDLVAFLGRCWGNDPENRLSTSEIIEWLKEYEKNLLSLPMAQLPGQHQSKGAQLKNGLLTNQEQRPTPEESSVDEEKGVGGESAEASEANTETEEVDGEIFSPMSLLKKYVLMDSIDKEQGVGRESAEASETNTESKEVDDTPGESFIPTDIVKEYCLDEPVTSSEVEEEKELEEMVDLYGLPDEEEVEEEVGEMVDLSQEEAVTPEEEKESDEYIDLFWCVDAMNCGDAFKIERDMLLHVASEHPDKMYMLTQRQKKLLLNE